MILALWLDINKGLRTQTHTGHTIITVGILPPYRTNILVGIIHLTTWKQHNSYVKTYPLRPSCRTELCSRNRIPIPQLYITQVPRTWRLNNHPDLCRFRAVLSYATHSLSDEPVLSILLGGLHPFFQGWYCSASASSGKRLLSVLFTCCSHFSW